MAEPGLRALRLWVEVATGIAVARVLGASAEGPATCLALTLALLRVRGAGPTPGFAPASRGRALARGAVGFALGWLAIPAVAAGVRGLGLALGLEEPPAPAAPGPWRALLLFVLAPALEEPLHRGWLLAGLRRRLGGAGAAIGSTAAFAVLHASPWGMLGATVYGVALCGLARRGRSLAACVGAHTGANVGLHAALLSPWLSPFAWLGPVDAALAGGLGAWLWLRRRRQAPVLHDPDPEARAPMRWALR